LAEGAWKQTEAFSRSTLEIRVLLLSVAKDEDDGMNPRGVLLLLEEVGKVGDE